MKSTAVNWYEGQPDNAGGIHGETDPFGFIEILRDIPGFVCVNGTKNQQDHVVQESQRDRNPVQFTGLHPLLLTVQELWKDNWRFDYEPEHSEGHLYQDQADAYDYLRSGTYVRWPLLHLQANLEYSRYSVGLGEDRRIAYG